MNSETTQRVSSVLKRALSERFLHDDQPLASFVDQHYLSETISHLKRSFPENFHHAFAVKANPYAGVLNLIQRLGMGAEVASGAELILADQAGFEPNDMVFDAPVKTMREIKTCLRKGIALNIDNYQEFERVKKWIKTNETVSAIGFRINPQVGAGEIALSSTATLTSKFGVGLEDSTVRDQLIAYYKDHPWLNLIHVHVGSVACPLALMADGILKTVQFAEEINEYVGAEQIKNIDIGGGLPLDFFNDELLPEYAEYSQTLQQTVPQLFSGKYKVLTEFGRSIIAKNAFSVGRVEYVKQVGGRRIAQTHLGAQALMRTVFQPKEWARPVSVYNSTGEPKITQERIEQDIAGPCCFAGDIIAHTRSLPVVEAGDWIVVHHTGAYAFANHFDYNALPQMPVYLADINADHVNLQQISKGQTIEDVAARYAE